MEKNRLRAKIGGIVFILLGVALFGYVGIYLLMLKPTHQMIDVLGPITDMATSIKQVSFCLLKMFGGLMAIVNGGIMILLGKVLLFEV